MTRQRIEREAARRLELLLGRYPAAQIKSATALPSLAPLADKTGPVTGIGTPQQVLSRRPDIIAAQARLKASGLDASAAQKAILPSLRLTATASGSSSDFSNLFDTDAMVGNFVAALTQPIFQGGRLRASAKAAQARQRANAYNYAQTVLNAFSEIENALMKEELLRVREDSLRTAYEEAVATEELTQRQYTNGTTNIFNLINAQQRRIAAESQFIQSQSERLSNRISLYMALGGTFHAGNEPMQAIAAGKRGKNSEADKKQSPNLFRRWWRTGATTGEPINTALAAKGVE